MGLSWCSPAAQPGRTEGSPSRATGSCPASLPGAWAFGLLGIVLCLFPATSTAHPELTPPAPYSEGAGGSSQQDSQHCEQLWHSPSCVVSVLCPGAAENTQEEENLRMRRTLAGASALQREPLCMCWRAMVTCSTVQVGVQHCTWTWICLLPSNPPF